MVVEKGRQINDFTLMDQNENEVSLSDFNGKKVLLSFHPLAFTSVCAKQMQALDDNYERFEKLNTVPLGISVDAQPSKTAWAETLGLKNLQILADFHPKGKLAKELGVYIEEEGFSGRANIIIDEKGEVIWTKVYELSQLPDVEEVISAVKDV
ncbi:MAG: redoxin domain-containing protein [Halanaerobiaceae bacterium]